MKIHIHFSVLIGLLFFSSITKGQTYYKQYVRQKTYFSINKVSNTTSSLVNSHIWLTNLNRQYTDTTSKKINVAAIPVYQTIPKNSLLNPRSTVNQIIGAMLPYGYYFPSPATYTTGAYTPANKMYKNQSILYGYSQYSTGTIGAPHYNYTLPKF